MRTDDELKQLKQDALDCLQMEVRYFGERLKAVDGRLFEFIDGVATNEPDTHNLYEVLGVLKFLRVFATYPFDVQRVQTVLRHYEGRWTENHQYIEGSGGLKFSGLQGRRHYQLTPIQVYMLTLPFGPHRWVDTGASAGSRGLLPTEEVRDGRIWDLRRLVTEVIYFIPRKFCKTTMGAFFQFEGFFFEDYNYEGYCCAGSQEQAKILFNMASDLIRQLDPDKRRIRFTATEVNFKPGQFRAAKLKVLSAGGKKKDGLFAQFVSSDEYGSSPYINDRSEMAELVEVMKSSMGPRREPLTIHTTTAGNVTQGPFKTKLEAVKEELIAEVAAAKDLQAKLAAEPRGTVAGTVADPQAKLAGTVADTVALQRENDWQAAVILEPDAWEMEEEVLFSDPNIWKKVNPHIGITVQADYYEQRIKESRLDPETKRETRTKLFNVWQGERVKEWLTDKDIHPLQVKMRVDDLRQEDGWMVFAGFDFSMGDDLTALAYFCSNPDTGEFFADCDAWITEDTLEKSSVKELYLKWVEQGWLHVCPGRVFQPSLAVGRVMELSEHVPFYGFGYDPYKAKQPINDLKAWLLALDLDPKEYIMPVRQNFGTFNPLVGELDLMVKGDPPMIQFSMSPLWGFCFNNCMLAETTDGMENRKPVKARPGSDSCKIDCVIALLEGIYLFDVQDGREREVEGM